MWYLWIWSYYQGTTVLITPKSSSTSHNFNNKIDCFGEIGILPANCDPFMASSSFSTCFGHEPPWLAQIIRGINLDPNHEVPNDFDYDMTLTEVRTDRIGRFSFHLSQLSRGFPMKNILYVVWWMVCFLSWVVYSLLSFVGSSWGISTVFTFM